MAQAEVRIQAEDTCFCGKIQLLPPQHTSTPKKEVHVNLSIKARRRPIILGRAKSVSNVNLKSFWIYFHWQQETRYQAVLVDEIFLRNALLLSCMKEYFSKELKLRKIINCNYRHFSQNLYLYFLKKYKLKHYFFCNDYVELKRNHNYELPSTVEIVPIEFAE